MTQTGKKKEEVTMKYYLGLFRKMDSVGRAKTLGVPYENDTFTVTMLGSTYQVRWPEGRIESEDPDAFALKSGDAKLLLLRYLVVGQPLPSTGKFMTFSELPWDESYAELFEKNCVLRAANKFGRNLAGFRHASSTMGGRMLTHADASYEFTLAAGYDLRLFIWEGDDAFPPKAQILYSENFAAGFSADGCVAAAEALIGSLYARMLTQTEVPDINPHRRWS